MTPTALSQDTVELVAHVAPLRIDACAARTYRGARRMINQDAMLVAGTLLAVADGVGGHRAGEEASTLTLDVLRREVRTTSPEPERELLDAESANARVRAAATLARRNGMATTVVAALVGQATVSIAHVGDSRAYLIRDGTVEQLTADHSLVATLLATGALDAAAARTYPRRSVILRAVGLDDDVRADIATRSAEPDDLLLLCSDGLTDPIAPDALERIARREADLDQLVDRLADAARHAGGGDDITIVAARLG